METRLSNTIRIEEKKVKHIRVKRESHWSYWPVRLRFKKIKNRAIWENMWKEKIQRMIVLHKKITIQKRKPILTECNKSTEKKQLKQKNACIVLREKSLDQKRWMEMRNENNWTKYVIACRRKRRKSEKQWMRWIIQYDLFTEKQNQGRSANIRNGPGDPIRPADPIGKRSNPMSDHIGIRRPGRRIRTPYTTVYDHIRSRIRSYTWCIRSVYDRIFPYYMAQYYERISPWPYTEKYGEKRRSYTERLSP
jgi:hypothetical protein